ncbi:hypothetical protein [Natronomonas sp. LN261]|uniref:hypothetical protein n=1 Tax=Natronomonas sp. LN261 TaxID=2750669 RepID=UPI0015EE8F99|nr:hypothetical protein [Natronomonas sp. LN261]
MSERERAVGRAVAIVLVLALAVAPIAPFVIAPSSAQSAPSGMVGVSDSQISDIRAEQGAGGLEASELTVYTSEHAETTSVSIVTAEQADEIAAGTALPDVANQRVCSTPAGDKNPNADCETTPSLVISDEEHSAGREVAVRADPLEDALGYTPSFLTVRNSESGEEWQYPTRIEDGWLIVDVEHFSSNTVEFQGTAEIDATATDGSQFTYGLEATDSVENFTIDVTGQIATQSETATLSGASDGDTVSYDIGGNIAPGGPSATDEPTVTFEGNAGDPDMAFTDSNSNLKFVDADGNVGDTGVTADDVGGVADFDDDGDQEIAFVGSNGVEFVDASGSTTTMDTAANDIGGVGDPDEDGDPEVAYMDGTNLQFVDGAGNIDDLGRSVNGVGGIGDVDDDGSPEIVAEGYTYDYLTYYQPDGTEDASFDTTPLYDAGTVGDIDGDGAVEAMYKNQNNNLGYADANGQEGTLASGIDFVGGAGDIDGDGEVEVSYDATGLKYVDGSGSVESTGLDITRAGGIADIDGDVTTDPAVDIDGDGTDETSVSGEVSGGETVTKEIASLSRSDSSATVSVSGGSVDVSIEYDERTETVDPAVSVNGNTVDHTGTLAEGDTVSLSTDASWLSDSNTVDVSMSAPASGPAPKVGLDYDHTATDQISTSYQATKFEERYNVSRTFADETADVQVTIPFDSSRMVSIGSVEYSVDGGSWQSVPDEHYALDGTTLTANLSDANGGAFPSGSTIEVNARGRKIQVDNGDVTVTDPSGIDEELDTEIRVDDRAPDFRMDVGPTESGDRVHYADSNEYPTEDYSIIKGDGTQYVYLPNAGNGDRFRMRHLETQVSINDTGDVRLEVLEAGEEPEIDVSPGPGGEGDEVTVRYYQTETGLKYVLSSIQDKIVIDSDVAESPAIFTTTDSEDTWTILEEAAGTASSSTGGVAQFSQRASGLFSSIPGGGLGLVAIVALAGGGWTLLRRRSPDTAGAVSSTAESTGSGILGVLERVLGYVGSLVETLLGNRNATIALAVGAALVGARFGFFQLPEGTAILLVVASVPIGSYVVLRRTGVVSQRVWLASTVVATILGLEFVAPGTVQTAIEQLTSENVAPLLILAAAGAVYLWYRSRQSDQPRIVIGSGED